MSTPIRQILDLAAQFKASDVHIAAGEVPAIRINGKIQRLDRDVLGPAEAREMVLSIMNDRLKALFEENLEVDFALSFERIGRCRVNVFTHQKGVGMVLRLIPTRVPSLDSLGAPPIFKTIASFRRGLVLVTGPTGSGKSTTLAAVIDHINRTRGEHIITVEDPVEFVHSPVEAIIHQREVGVHTHSFSNALRSALREDPDVVLVGEMRDLETVRLALTAAETGHLVFGTLHTNSAPETIDRIIDSYPADQQSQVRTMLSVSLAAVISQVLVRDVSGRGRVAVHEVMVLNNAIRNLIRENKLFQIASVMQSNLGEGMETMEHALKRNVSEGRITRDMAVHASGNPHLFEDLLGRR